jgi:retron-type reverse transcriptase
VQIPKGDGSKTRPIGIPTFEDKVLQRAVLMALEAVYEQDFYDFSYGFRPKRSAHQALDSLWNKLIKMGARVVRHARAITFQLAEVAVTGPMVRAILAAIHRLRVPPLCA